MRRAHGNWRILQDSMFTILRSESGANTSNCGFGLLTIGAAGRCLPDLCLAAALVDLCAELGQSWTCGIGHRG